MTSRIRPDKDTLDALYHDGGMTLQAIGDRYGVTREAVRQWLHYYGISKRLALSQDADFLADVRRRIEDDCQTAEDVAEHHGVSAATIYRVIQENEWRHPRYQRGKTRQILALYRQGMSYRQIADTLDTPYPYVCRVVCRWIPANERPGKAWRKNKKVQP